MARSATWDERWGRGDDETGSGIRKEDNTRQIRKGIWMCENKYLETGVKVVKCKKNKWINEWTRS